MATLRILGNSSAAPPAGGACAAYLVETDSARVLLDIGPGSLAQLRAATGVHDLDAVFISHMHTDHWLDLLALNVALFVEQGHRMEHGARKRLPVYVPPGGLATVTATFAGLATGVIGTNASRWEEAIDCREYDPAEVIEAAGASVSFVGPTKHSTTDYGMRVRAGGGLLGYTGDTARCDAAVEVGRGASLFLAECTLMEPGPASHTHTCTDELIEMAAAAKPERLLATHFIDHSAPWRAELATRLDRGLDLPATVVSLGDRFEF